MPVGGVVRPSGPSRWPRDVLVAAGSVTHRGTPAAQLTTFAQRLQRSPYTSSGEFTRRQQVHQQEAPPTPGDEARHDLSHLSRQRGAPGRPVPMDGSLRDHPSYAARGCATNTLWSNTRMISAAGLPCTCQGVTSNPVRRSGPGRGRERPDSAPPPSTLPKRSSNSSSVMPSVAASAPVGPSISCPSMPSPLRPTSVRPPADTGQCASHHRLPALRATPLLDGLGCRSRHSLSQ